MLTNIIYIFYNNVHLNKICTIVRYVNMYINKTVKVFTEGIVDTIRRKRECIVYYNTSAREIRLSQFRRQSRRPLHESQRT